MELSDKEIIKKISDKLVLEKRENLETSGADLVSDAKAKSESDALAKHNEAIENLKDAAAAGSEVADVLLKDPALAEDAKTVAEISKVVEEMGNGGKVDGETLDKAITDTNAEIEKLKKDHSEEAAKLEEMLTKLENLMTDEEMWLNILDKIHLQKPSASVRIISDLARLCADELSIITEKRETYQEIIDKIAFKMDLDIEDNEVKLLKILEELGLRKNLVHRVAHELSIRTDAYIIFESDCNNEIEEKDDCFAFKKIDGKTMTCKPLITQLDIEENENNIEDFNTKIDNLFNDNSDNFISQGSYNSAFIISNVTTESGKKNYVLRMTDNLTCEGDKKNISNELLGLHYQTYFSKSITSGGLGCEGICKVYDFGKYEISNSKYLPQIPSGNRQFTSKIGVYAFLEYLPGGELFDRITSDRWVEMTQEKEKIDKTRAIIKNLLQTLKCIHDAGYVHLDLKPENIMMVYGENDNKPSNLSEITDEKWYFLRDTEIKLIDFGFMKSKDEKKNDIFGSPGYVSTDFVDPSVKKYNSNFDIWAVGIITYICIFNEWPAFPVINWENKRIPDIPGIALKISPEQKEMIEDQSLKDFFEDIFENRKSTDELLNSNFINDTVNNNPGGKKTNKKTAKKIQGKLSPKGTKKRPRGKAPKGKRWDYNKGCWINL
jgi:hypothetical protein